MLGDDESPGVRLPDWAADARSAAIVICESKQRWAAAMGAGRPNRRLRWVACRATRRALELARELQAQAILWEATPERAVAVAEAMPAAARWVGAQIVVGPPSLARVAPLYWELGATMVETRTHRAAALWRMIESHESRRCPIPRTIRLTIPRR